MPTAWLTCPAYPPRDTALANLAVRRAQDLCAALDLDLRCSPLLSLGSGLRAHPLELRRQDLATWPQHDLIIALRGGYGCIHLAEELTAVAASLPPLVGFSDLTVVHAARLRAGRSDGVHGAMPGVDHGAQAATTLLALLRGQHLVYGPAQAPQAQVLIPGRASGPLVPACLRVLTGLVGTPLMPDLRGCILAVEDIDERGYELDRDLQQLHLAGCLIGVAGLIFGIFPGPEHAGPTPREVATTWAARLAVPALVGLPFGHDPDPLALPVGGHAVLDLRGQDWSLGFPQRPPLVPGIH